MPPEQQKQPINREQSFPWKCQHCFQQEIQLTTISYDVEVRHNSRLHKLNIPKLKLPVCQACGEKVFTEDVDVQVNNALHSYLNLLTTTPTSDTIL